MKLELGSEQLVLSPFCPLFVLVPSGFRVWDFLSVFLNGFCGGCEGLEVGGWYGR